MNIVPAPVDSRAVLSGYVRARVVTPELLLSLAAVAGSIGQQVREHGSFACPCQRL
ncbi:MAG: hypothetical protein P0107_09655 [Nitrosomonas sp.]|nr:hypothetical protein [Nitrosomonas sp.]